MTSIEYLQKELGDKVNDLPPELRAEAARSFLDAAELTRGVLGGAQLAQSRLAVVRATWLQYLSGLSAEHDAAFLATLKRAWDQALELFGDAAISAAKDALAEGLRDAS